MISNPNSDGPLWIFNLEQKLLWTRTKKKQITNNKQMKIGDAPLVIATIFAFCLNKISLIEYLP